MTHAGRISRIEASTTATDVVLAWLAAARAHPSLEAYVAACAAASPPLFARGEVGREVLRKHLPLSRGDASARERLTTAIDDADVLFELATGLEADASSAAALLGQALPHHYYRLLVLRSRWRPSRSEDDIESTLRLWTKSAVGWLDLMRVRQLAHGMLKQDYFRGHEV
jgi:hypothetical protein